MNKEFKINGFWVSVGVGKRFSIGFCIDKYCLNIDLICFWVSVEF
jgi:hypothetical protein